MFPALFLILLIGKIIYYILSPDSFKKDIEKDKNNDFNDNDFYD
jgi:hypothetical protein